MTTGRINQVAIGQTCETSVKAPFRERTELPRPGNDFRMRSEQPKLRTAYTDTRLPERRPQSVFSPGPSRREGQGTGEISRGASRETTLERVVRAGHLALSKRRPAPLCRGRPYQDKVRSVMYVIQDRHASRDQQPHGASARGTACRTLGRVAAGQSLSCQCQMIGKQAQSARGATFRLIDGFPGRLARVACLHIYTPALTSIAATRCISPAWGRYACAA